MRDALTDEVAANPKLSRTLVQDTFAYYDQRETAAEKRADDDAKKAAKDKKDKASPAIKPEGSPAGG